MVLDVPIRMRTVPRIAHSLCSFFVKSFQRREIRPKYVPSVVYLEICRSCNLNCPMCLRRVLPSSELSGNMDLDTAKNIINNLGKVVGIGLSGWGEPLLHPQIIDLLRYISEKGILISFDTNGVLLKDYARELVKIKTLYHIGLSIDFISKEVKHTHTLITSLEGLKAILDEKRKICRRYPHLRVTMTVMKCNVAEIPRIVMEIAKYGCKWFDCHLVIVFDKTLPEEYKRPDINEFVRYFNEAKKIGREKGIKVTYERKERVMLEDKGVTICNEPWKAPFIDYKGMVHPCCFYLTKKLGDARTQLISEIWRGELYMDFRRQLLHKEEPFCRNCMEGMMYLNFYRR